MTMFCMRLNTATHNQSIRHFSPDLMTICLQIDSHTSPIFVHIVLDMVHHRELGLPKYFDTEDGEKQLSVLAKQAYRRGNHFNSMRFNAEEWNRVWVMDRLEMELAHQGLEKKKTLEEEKEADAASKHAFKRAVTTGESCLTGATDVVPVLLLKWCASGEPVGNNIWRKHKVKLARELVAEVEGLQEFDSKLDAWLQRQAGDARVSSVLRRSGPQDGMIYVHNTLVVAPGRVEQHRRGAKDVMPVRASTKYHGRVWRSDVEVEGETEGEGGTTVEESWYARVLLLFR